MLYCASRVCYRQQIKYRRLITLMQCDAMYRTRGDKTGGV